MQLLMWTLFYKEKTPPQTMPMLSVLHLFVSTISCDDRVIGS